MHSEAVVRENCLNCCQCCPSAQFCGSTAFTFNLREDQRGSDYRSNHEWIVSHGSWNLTSEARFDRNEHPLHCKASHTNNLSI